MRPALSKNESTWRIQCEQYAAKVQRDDPRWNGQVSGRIGYRVREVHSILGHQKTVKTPERSAETVETKKRERVINQGREKLRVKRPLCERWERHFSTFTERQIVNQAFDGVVVENIEQRPTELSLEGPPRTKGK